MKDKGEGKGEPAVLSTGKGKGKWRKPSSAKHLQDKLAARKTKSTWSVDNVVIGLAIVDALERETRISRLGHTNICCRIVKIAEPS